MFLNVGYQQGCKVVIYGTSIKTNIFILPTCLSSLFIHCTAAELTADQLVFYSCRPIHISVANYSE